MPKPAKAAGHQGRLCAQLRVIDTELKKSKDKLEGLKKRKKLREENKNKKESSFHDHLCSGLIWNASGHASLQGIFRGVGVGGGYQQVHLEASPGLWPQERARRGGRRAKGRGESQRLEEEKRARACLRSV